jgi:hypothetical protein
VMWAAGRAGPHHLARVARADRTLRFRRAIGDLTVRTSAEADCRSRLVRVGRSARRLGSAAGWRASGMVFGMATLTPATRVTTDDGA